MSQIIDTASATVKRSLVPWIATGFLATAILAAGTGLYFGAVIQRGWDASDKIAMANAYGDALRERDARLKELQAKGSIIEGNFLTALKDMQVINRTYYNEVQKETEKVIYTDCKVPDSGVELLNRHIDEVNLRLIGKGSK